MDAKDEYIRGKNARKECKNFKKWIGWMIAMEECKEWMQRTN